MRVETCAEGIDLDACGIAHGHCIDADLIERISGKKLTPRGRTKVRSTLNEDVGLSDFPSDRDRALVALGNKG